MTIDEMKVEVQKWVDQIGFFNEGCGCKWCTIQIREKINEAINKYISKIESCEL